MKLAETKWTEALVALERIIDPDRIIDSGDKLEKLSRDYYWYSPVLKRLLDDKKADFAVTINSRDELREALKVLHQYQVPVSIRGGGTGNYGQLIPLAGGAVLDLSGMKEIFSINDGILCCEPGVRIETLEVEAGKLGYEMKCIPSTWVKSALGGFLAGGSGGIGSITYGGLAEPGTVRKLTLMSVEAEPREIVLEGTECLKTLHTYGTNGVIVEIEMSLAPKRNYDQLIITHDDWDALFAWTDAFAHDSSINKRLATMVQAPVPDAFLPFKKYLEPGVNVAFVMVEETSTEQVIASAEAAGLKLARKIPALFPPKPPYVTDFTWNHTTLWMLKKDPTVTYLQLGFGNEGYKARMDALSAAFPGEIFHHLEWVRHERKIREDGYGYLNVAGLPIVAFKNEARLQEIIDFCHNHGIGVANPHTYFLEEGGRHPNLDDKKALKRELDPLGLLNPGKMKTYLDDVVGRGAA